MPAWGLNEDGCRPVGATPAATSLLLKLESGGIRDGGLQDGSCVGSGRMVNCGLRVADRGLFARHDFLQRPDCCKTTMGG